MQPKNHYRMTPGVRHKLTIYLRRLPMTDEFLETAKSGYFDEFAPAYLLMKFKIVFNSVLKELKGCLVKLLVSYRSVYYVNCCLSERILVHLWASTRQILLPSSTCSSRKRTFCKPLAANGSKLQRTLAKN